MYVNENQMNAFTPQTRLPNSSDLNDMTVSHLTDLINRVYDVAESGMWKPNVLRTTKNEVRKYLESSQLILTELNGMIVGSVHVEKLEDDVTEFGMLVSSLEHRGIGIGSKLVQAAEQWAKDNGCKTMRLTLLTPRSWKHPSKEFLKEWYSRIGYKPQFTEPLEKTYPEKLQELATDCDYTVWLKPLN